MELAPRLNGRMALEGCLPFANGGRPGRRGDHGRGVGGIGDDSPVLEDDELRAALQQARAMGDQDDGAAAHQPPDRLHDRCLRLVIDGARRLVQDEHWAVLQEGPGNGDALALAARELDAALAHLGVIGLREPDDELVGVRRLRRRDQVALAGPRLGVSNVLGDAGREEHRVLRYYRELPAEILKPEVAEVDAVKPDLTLCREIEPREQADQRALARAGRARDSQAGARLDVERDVVQDRTIPAIGEGAVPKRDGAAGPPEELGIRSLLDVRWLVEQGEGPLGTRQMEL